MTKTIVIKNSMKVILSGELDGEADFILNDLTIQELKTLIAMRKAQTSQSLELNPAQVAGTLISLGIDHAFMLYAKLQIKSMSDNVKSWLSGT